MDTAGYLHKEVLSKSRYLVVSVDRHGLVVKQECPGIDWRLESIRTGRMLPDDLRSVLDSAGDASAPQLFPYVQLADGVTVDVHVLDRGDDKQIILHDVSEGHDDEHRLQQKVHEVSLLLDQQARLTAQLEASRREVERASEAQSRFMAGMSHEFRTPLAAILAQAETLQSGGSGQEAAASIRQAAWHLLTLVENLLEHARMAEGSRAPHLATVNVAELFDEMHRLFGPAADAAGLNFEVKAPAGPVHVDTDGRRLRQVLINLLGNAFRFTEKGRVVLRADAGTGDTLLFEVEDTGSGIDAADLDSIFEPFNRVSDHDRGGAGLGLSISRHLVEELGGRLQVSSTPGEGSRFHFDIPLAGSIEPQSLHGLSVLLVEDDPDLRKLYCNWLSAEGCAVSEAADLSGAVDQLDGALPDVVVTDLNLPDGSGTELLSRIRSSGNGIATVLCSGESQLDNADPAASQADAWLCKPLSAQQLKEAVGRVARARATDQ